MASILNHTVEFRHLLYFRAVAEEGSFTRAAGVIGLSQPTLSQQIKQLEDELGAVLFHRARHSCRLTSAGEMLLPYARRVLGEMDDLRRSLDDMSGLRRGSLVIATLPVLSHRVMPLVLGKYHQEHPGIRVRMLEMSVDEMERAMVLGTAELGIGFMPTSQTSLREEVLFTEDLVAVLRAGDPLANKTAVDMVDLAKRPLLVPPPGYGTRMLILNSFAKVRRIPNIVMESSSVEVLTHMVSEDGGVAILPASSFWGRKMDANVMVKNIRSAPQRRIGLINLHGAPSRPAVEAFVPVLKSVVKSLAG